MFDHIIFVLSVPHPTLLGAKYLSHYHYKGKEVDEESWLTDLCLFMFLGVEAFESAISFWEQAVDDLQHGTEEDTLDETVSHYMQSV